MCNNLFRNNIIKVSVAFWLQTVSAPIIVDKYEMSVGKSRSAIEISDFVADEIE